MTQSSEPSYLLADFPSTDNPPDTHNKKDATATDLSVNSADAPRPKSQIGERGFKRKFIPGRLFADCAATFVPIALVTFAIAIMRLDNKETERQEYRKWINAINVIASAFPIAFASIVGRMVFEAARWKLEKGATLGLLEQLIGSRTVGSTFITQIYLGKFNVLGLVLLSLWAFSPLGSQAVLRTLGSKLQPVFSNSSILYFSTDAQTRLAEGIPRSQGSAAREAQDFGHLKSMFAALFFTSEERKTDPMDIWGNVKIPNVDINDKEWHNVTAEPSPDSYSALLGLPVTNVTTGNVTFLLESSYIHLECWNFTTSMHGGLSFPFLNWTEFYRYVGELETHTTVPPTPIPNSTWRGRGISDMKSPWTMAVDRFVDPYWSIASNRWAYGHPKLFKNETDLNIPATNLLFMASFGGWLTNVKKSVKAECFVTQRYVESRVHCSRVDTSTVQNCSVIAQRLSRKEHATENITMLNWPLIWSRVLDLRTLLDGDSSSADAILRYLSDPRLNAVTRTDIDADLKLFDKTTAEQFSRRLGQVINTYLLLSQVYQSAMQLDQVSNFNTTVTAERTYLVEVYVVNWSWSVLFLISSLLLLASGIVSIIFAHLAIGPEVLGYASTVVHSSKYVELPAEASKKEAFEVVKIMGPKRLRYGYVDTDGVDGQPLVGVGLESETGDIHRR
ncbi:hypothetical protein FIE12Z_5124 [Fusarium flagelliforme]|uniref:Uncharacterized protein n=1 Tax=Fusarium flagelliforme TaxID=2675880 RepID=A0A395MS51_9HYPO|nr:hypothetical protein FIE12Z_5124 [Fusarium flagelliforme]